MTKEESAIAKHTDNGSAKQSRGKYIFKYYARACVRRYFQYDVGRESAALAYYLLFSMFPLMIFFSILLSYTHLSQSPIIAGLYNFLPTEAAGIIAYYLRHVSSMQFGPMTLSVLFCCLWFPMRATNSLLTAIRKGIGRKPISHGFLRTQLHLLLYAVFLMFAILFSVLFMVLSDNLLELLSARSFPCRLFLFICGSASACCFWPCWSSWCCMSSTFPAAKSGTLHFIRSAPAYSAPLPPG